MRLKKSPERAGRKISWDSRAARLARPLNLFRTKRETIMSYNPADGEQARKDAAESVITVFNYANGGCTKRVYSSVEEVFHFRDEDSISWINIDGIIRQQVIDICSYFQVHQLTLDDILSVGQRAKMDDLETYIFCLLPMLYYNDEFYAVEREQVSLLLFKNVVISFQEDQKRDAFDPVREKLHMDNSRLSTSSSDALYNALLDAIVDQYFGVMEKMGIGIENVEDHIIKTSNDKTMVRINHFRREVNLLRRSMSPVRELISGILKTESALIHKKTKTYFKDVYDHIIQANETADNYRELIVSLQDLYLNQMNLKMNVVMKVLAVVTALFAPLTLITGIYGMNFDNMPELHTRYGYFITLGVMLVLVCGMLLFFRKKGWF